MWEIKSDQAGIPNPGPLHLLWVNLPTELSGYCNRTSHIVIFFTLEWYNISLKNQLLGSNPWQELTCQFQVLVTSPNVMEWEKKWRTRLKFESMTLESLEWCFTQKSGVGDSTGLTFILIHVYQRQFLKTSNVLNLITDSVFIVHRSSIIIVALLQFIYSISNHYNLYNPLLDLANDVLILDWHMLYCKNWYQSCGPFSSLFFEVHQHLL